ncbi:MAG: hypothetical protein RJB08_480 [Actinomycetota bacterium]
MNTNRFNNKNLKRVAAGAGITAAALFLTAGLVAGIGGGNAADGASAPTTVVADVMAAPVAAESTAADENVAVVAEPANVALVASSNKATSTVKTAKPKQKKSSATNGNVIISAPEAPATTVAAAVPAAADQSAPAPTSPADQSTAAAPTAQQPAATTTSGSTTSTGIKMPSFSGTPSITSIIDLATTLSSPVTLPKVCVSITC